MLLFIKPGKSPSERKTVNITGTASSSPPTSPPPPYTKCPPEGDKTLTVGIVVLPSFYGSAPGEAKAKASDDVEELVEKLKALGAEGIILDLRRNGGGYLSEAVNLAGLFISRGPVVQVKSTDGKIRKKFDFNPKLAWEGPLALLVSRYSASASEIVAGALQNHDRAIIIGDKATHGSKPCSMIETTPLPFRSQEQEAQLPKSRLKYYLPSGKSTQNAGVVADVSMPSSTNSSTAKRLPHAMEWTRYPPSTTVAPPMTHGEEERRTADASLKRQDEEEEFVICRTNSHGRDRRSFPRLDKRLKGKAGRSFPKGLNEEVEELAEGIYRQRIRLNACSNRNGDLAKPGRRAQESGSRRGNDAPSSLTFADMKPCYHGRLDPSAGRSRESGPQADLERNSSRGQFMRSLARCTQTG